MCLLTVLVSVGYPRWESVEFGLHYYDYNNYSWILLLFKWAFFFVLSFSYSLLLYFYLAEFSFVNHLSNISFNLMTCIKSYFKDAQLSLF